MKKLLFLIVAIVVLGLIISGCSLLGVTPTEKDEVASLTKAPKVKPPSGAHYNLNIIGKKWDWKGGGSYDNESRHTMFVPEDIGEYNQNAVTPCYTPMGTPSDAPPGADYSDPRLDEPGITIWMTKGDEYAVLDGNAFDDCKCEFELDPGTYQIWIVVKAKPPKPGEDRYTDITGWVRFIDPDNNLDYLACDLGDLRVKKNMGWKDVTDDLFFFEGMWLFDYLEYLEEEGYTDTAYFWQYDNHGNKLVKVRFYEK